MGAIRGVNLGNWLVLEKWMGNSPLAQARSDDDRGLVDEYAPIELDALLDQHRRTYVTQDTFAWLADHGVQLVRLPVPYHLFGTAHHRSCIAYVDKAMAWAQAYGLGVLLDLHTVPMSQNASDNGGYMGLCEWHKDPGRIVFVLDVLQRMSRRYAGHPALWGLEPLNEPANLYALRKELGRYASSYPERAAASSPMPRAMLRSFYERFYDAVRPIVGPDVQLVFHDRFELPAWNGLLARHRDPNVWLDTHQYVCFTEFGFRRRDLREYERRAWLMGRLVRRAAKHHPVLVGEWSLANHADLSMLGAQERQDWYRAFARAQQRAWDQGGGSCFWSYRVDAPDRENWSFFHCARNGWLSMT